jgi:hypothetical protein
VGDSPTVAWEAAPDRFWAEVAKLTAPDGDGADYFGNSVALSGERALVGAYRDDDRGDTSGSVYVFERQEGGTWAKVAKLTASDAEVGDHFGGSVALSGERALIGAWGDADQGLFSGSAYVFERQEDGTWAEVAKLTALDGTAGDYFGRFVALSGARALVGASGDDALMYNSGSAYVFERQEDGTWAEVAKLTASDAGLHGDFFGSSVALSGARALVGADGDDAPMWDSGSAYVFERQEDGTWIEEDKLTASDGRAGDHFGGSVALSGARALVGAVNGAGVDGEVSGSAYVFERHEDGTWAEVAKLTASDGEFLDRFGFSVALSGERALVGAFYGSGVQGESGSAYVFERQEDGTWIEEAELTASDGRAGDHFGISVALSGAWALVGAWGDADQGLFSGSAYFFKRQVCEVDLALEPPALRAGEELRVTVAVEHRRPVTVTVPFLMWVEDAEGRLVARRSSPPKTMEPGDRVEVTLAFTLPADLPAGGYRVLMGVERMQQGVAWASRWFQVIE